jgi:hypothetical protein
MVMPPLGTSKVLYLGGSMVVLWGGSFVEMVRVEQGVVLARRQRISLASLAMRLWVAGGDWNSIYPILGLPPSDLCRPGMRLIVRMEVVL